MSTTSLSWQPWCLEATNAQDAGGAVIQALRTKLTGAAEDSVGAGRFAYETLDNFVINSEGIDVNTPGAEEKILTHPLVQRELARQRRDLGDLRAGEEDIEATIARLRDRAKVEAESVLGP